MEEKERLINRVNDVKNDKRIIQEWMVIENNRLRELDILNTAKAEAREEGIEKGIEQKELEVIKNMLNESTDLNFISKITGKSIEEIKEIESNKKF